MDKISSILKDGQGYDDDYDYDDYDLLPSNWEGSFLHGWQRIQLHYLSKLRIFLNNVC